MQIRVLTGITTILTLALFLAALPAHAAEGPRFRIIQPVAGQSVTERFVLQIAFESIDESAIVRVDAHLDNTWCTGGRLNPAVPAGSFDLSCDLTRIAAPPGPHVLYVRLTDSMGRVTQHEVAIRYNVALDTTPPTIRIIEPGDNAEITGPMVIRLEAADNAGIKLVMLFINDRLRAMMNEPPYLVPWDPIQEQARPGTYVLRAKVVDLADNEATSAPVRLILRGAAGRTQIETPLAPPTEVTPPGLFLPADPVRPSGGPLAGRPVFSNVIMPVATWAGSDRLPLPDWMPTRVALMSMPSFTTEVFGLLPPKLLPGVLTPVMVPVASAGDTPELPLAFIGSLLPPRTSLEVPLTPPPLLAPAVASEQPAAAPTRAEMPRQPSPAVTTVPAKSAPVMGPVIRPDVPVTPAAAAPAPPAPSAGPSLMERPLVAASPATPLPGSMAASMPAATPPVETPARTEVDPTGSPVLIAMAVPAKTAPAPAAPAGILAPAASEAMPPAPPAITSGEAPRSTAPATGLTLPVPGLPAPAQATPAPASATRLSPETAPVPAPAGLPAKASPGAPAAAAPRQVPTTHVEQAVAVVEVEAPYRTRDGETIELIARAHGTTPDELLRLNPGITPGRPLPADTRLIVPQPQAHIYLDNIPLAGGPAPFVVEGYTMVPMRRIVEARNGVVIWLPQTQEVNAWADNTFMGLRIGDRLARINSDTYVLPVAPVLAEERTMVPLRYLMTALNLHVEYNPASGTYYLVSRAAP